METHWVPMAPKASASQRSFRPRRQFSTPSTMQSVFESAAYRPRRRECAQRYRRRTEMPADSLVLGAGVAAAEVPVTASVADQLIQELPFRWSVQGRIFLIGGLAYMFDAW